ncbi:MAG: hypothetical protein R2851_03230 [Caldilineaceae bacterium]
MPTHRMLRTFALCLVMLIGALIFAPRLWGAQPGTDLDTVWARVAASGGYRFRADVTQTSVPAATVRNAGQRSRTTTMYMDGTTDLDAEAMHLTLWSNGGSAGSGVRRGDPDRRRHAARPPRQRRMGGDRRFHRSLCAGRRFYGLHPGLRPMWCNTRRPCAARRWARS